MPGTGSYYCNIGLVKALCSSDHKHNDVLAVCLFEIEFEILKNSQGYHTVPASFEIWETFGNVPYNYSAKNMTSHMHRFGVSAVAEAFSDMIDGISERAKEREP